jgi:hypothetical protein
VTGGISPSISVRKTTVLCSRKFEGFLDVSRWLLLICACGGMFLLVPYADPPLVNIRGYIGILGFNTGTIRLLVGTCLASY